MISKPINDVALADLQELVANDVHESRTLEYKRELPSSADAGTVRILREISAFANTDGGDLLYGVEESDGVAIALPGIPVPNEDALRQRLENMCRDGLQPRMGPLEIKFIPVTAEQSVLAVRVRRSSHGPHRVTAGGHAHFYGRNANGCYQLDVGELRAVFVHSQRAAEKALAFRADRMLKIASDETPVPLEAGGRLILHVASMDAFAPRGASVAWPSGDQRSAFGPLGWVCSDIRINLEGFVCSAANYGQPTVAYTQFLRPGIAEAVVVFGAFQDGTYCLAPKWYERQVLQATDRYTSILQTLGASARYVVLLAFSGVRGYKLTGDWWVVRMHQDALDRDLILLPPAVIEEAPDEAAIVEALRPLFDQVWNAFGREKSLNFDDAGRWIT